MFTATKAGGTRAITPAQLGRRNELNNLSKKHILVHFIQWCCYILLYMCYNFFLEKFEFSPAPLFCVVDQFHNTHSYTMILVCGDATLYMLYIIWAMIILTYFLKILPHFFLITEMQFFLLYMKINFGFFLSLTPNRGI